MLGALHSRRQPGPLLGTATRLPGTSIKCAAADNQKSKGATTRGPSSLNVRGPAEAVTAAAVSLRSFREGRGSSPLQWVLEQLPAITCLSLAVL